MKFRGTLITDVSGSLAGATASRAKGGVTYLRERITPTNPNTSRQQVVRSALGVISAAWKSTLTPTERLSWIALADGSPANGLSLFVKGNVARIQSSMDQVLEYDDSLAEVPLVLGSATNASTAISTTWTGDGAEDVDGTGLLLFIQQPTPPSVTNNERYRLLGSVQGDSVSAPTSPLVAVSPWANEYQAGDTSKIRAFWTDPSGRYVPAGETVLTWA